MSATTPLTRTPQEGKDWTLAWQQKYHGILPCAYRIPADDLVACFNEMNINFTIDAATNKLQIVPSTYPASIRAYMADNKGDFKLLIVGNTTTDGKTYKDIINTNGGPSGIYDFTTPCPNDCDPGSILNHKLK